MMTRNNAGWLLIACATIFLLLATPSAFSQGVGASLSGQVTDQTGAAVAHAVVKVSSEDTGTVLSTTSSDLGVYRVGPLPPGVYQISISAPGFKEYIQRGINIVVATASTQNVILSPGSVTQTVRVVAGAQLLNTTNASLGQTIASHEITQLPLNGRDPSSLVYLAPGITGGNPFTNFTETGFTFATETSVSGNGGRQNSSYALLDGVPNMDIFDANPAPFPNADATREFRVITNNFNAAYGFAPSSIISIQTKSGTNAFHGGAFWYYRNSAFNASDWFSHQVNPLNRKQYGGFIGGPIKQNKLFFFANYQGTRSSSASTSSNAIAPTAAMLNGDFSAFSSNGEETLAPPFHMVNGVPNQIDPSLFNPASVKVDQDILPLGQQPTGLFFYTSPMIKTNFDEGTGRIDWNPSERQQVFLRSFITSSKQPQAGIQGNLFSNSGRSIQIYFNEALGDTWIISPTLVNNLSLFWDSMSAYGGSTGAQTKGGQPFCMSKYVNTADPEGQCSTEGFSVFGAFFGPYLVPNSEGRSTYGFYDNVTKTWKNNVITFGVDLQHQMSNFGTQYPTAPILYFTGQYTGLGMADFLLGDLFSINQGGALYSQQNNWQLGLYLGDQYRATPNLTVEAGIRWQPNFPPQIGAGRAAAFVPGQQSTVYPNAPTGLVYPGDRGIGAGLMRPSYGYYQPRVGIAWEPRRLPNTSIRAGFGLFVDSPIYSTYSLTTGVAPFAPTYYRQGASTTPLNFSDPWQGYAPTGGTSPFPPFPGSSFKPPPTATFPSVVSVPATIATNSKLGTTASWNLSVQQQVGQNMALQVAYIGSESYRLPVEVDLNPGIFASGGIRSTYTQFNQIIESMSTGTANYHSLQVSLERRLNHGLQFNTNFTWSKAIDDVSIANPSYNQHQIPNPFDLGFSRGISDENVPLRWITSLIYTVPDLSHHNGWVRQALGGWQISFINTSQSGYPFTITGGFGGNQSGALQGLDRADRVPGEPLQRQSGGRSNWLNHYFNINAFRENAPGTFGNSGKNIMRGPDLNFMDAGIAKNWTFRERYGIQVRWEMFNAFNHPSFGEPDNINQISASGTNFGGTEGQITYVNEPARIGQLALRFTF